MTIWCAFQPGALSRSRQTPPKNASLDEAIGPGIQFVSTPYLDDQGQNDYRRICCNSTRRQDCSA